MLIKTIFLIYCCLIISFICSAQTQQERKNNRIAFEKQIFPGAKLAKNFKFNFNTEFEEKFIPTKDDIKLNALLFKAQRSKGLIFYLHGSNNALNVWGKLAPTYTRLQYDVLMLDYRGYGKSEGTINDEEQLYADIQGVYDYIKTIYPEKNIIILGHSIGTGLAARLASMNHPKQLILQAPYYSMTDWVLHIVPTFDTTLIRYKLRIYQFVQKTSAPIVIFHGDADDAIYSGSSKKLKTFFKPTDKLILLKGEGHNDLTNNKEYLKALLIFIR